MKWTGKIFVLLLVLILFKCAVAIRESESRLNESDFPTASETELLSTFESVTPDSSSLAAFDLRAIEKAEEFFDLATIISDSQIPDKMRREASAQCLELFEKNNGYVILENKKMEATEFINQLFNSEITLIKPQNFKLSNDFAPHFPDGSFINQITFTYGDDLKSGKTMTLLIKVQKIFGEEKRSIWEVYLQEVYI